MAIEVVWMWNTKPFVLNQLTYVNKLSDAAVSYDLDLSRTLNRNKTEPPFAAKHIVLLQDGACASTCSLFSELMKTQGHVKTVVVGGRPQYGPMQAVGGTKGTNEFAFNNIHDLATGAFNNSDSTTQQEMASEDFSNLRREGGQAIKRLSKAGVNYRDNIRKGDTTNTPLQFVYEAADCRLFYTRERYVDVRELWRDVGLTQWGEGASNGTSPLCVRGSTGHPSAESKEGIPWGVQAVSNGTTTSTPPPPTASASTSQSVQPSSTSASSGPSAQPSLSPNAAASLQISMFASGLAALLAWACL